MCLLRHGEGAEGNNAVGKVEDTHSGGEILELLGVATPGNHAQ